METKLAIICSEWDAIIYEIDDYTSVEVIEKFAELSKGQADTLDEIIEVKRALKDAARRES